MVYDEEEIDEVESGAGNRNPSLPALGDLFTACRQLQSLTDFKQRRRILKCSLLVYRLGFSGCMRQKIASDEIEQQVNLLGLAGRRWKRLTDREGTCACPDIQWAESTRVSVMPFFFSRSLSILCNYSKFKVPAERVQLTCLGHTAASQLHESRELCFKELPFQSLSQWRRSHYPKETGLCWKWKRQRMLSIQ